MLRFDIFRPVLDELQSLSQNRNIDILVDVESQIAFEDLCNFLAESVSKNGELSLLTLKPLCDFLAHRDSMAYFIGINSIAHQAYIKVAQKISELTNTSIAALLVPKLLQELVFIDTKNKEFDFQGIILSAEGRPQIKHAGEDIDASRQLQQFHEKILLRIRNLKNLVAIMSSRMHSTRWIDLLTAINDEHLFRIVLMDREWKDAVRTASFNTDETNNKAILFCLAETYWRKRKTQSYHTSWTGSLISQVNTGLSIFSKNLAEKGKKHIEPPTKQDKEAAVKDYLEFIVSSKSLSERDTHFSDPKYKHSKNALKTGDLSILWSQTELVANPVVVNSKPLRMM